MPPSKNFETLHKQVTERPGAAERLAALRAETLAEIRLYQLDTNTDHLESEAE